MIYPVDQEHPVLKALLWYLTLQREIADHLGELEERVKKLEESFTRIPTED